MPYRHINVDWSNLAADYERLGSCRAVAAEYGVHHETVRTHMVKRGIAREFDLTKTGGESQRGREAELFVMGLLKGSEDLAKTNPQAPFDILWDGKAVDVKRSNLLTNGHKPWWMFRTKEYIRKDCDFVACVGYKDESPHFVLLIPSSEVPLTGITVNLTSYERSKYRKYQIWSKECVIA